MRNQIAIAALVLVLGAIVLGRVDQPTSPESAPSTASAVSSMAPSTAPTRHLGPLKATLQDPPLTTPAIDLNARLATRRRIEREGRRVYLDSIFASTDSVVIRWGSDHDPIISVRFEPDTLLKGWRGALDDARAGLQAWNSNSSSFAFQETTDSTADVVVRWNRMMAEESQLGLTSVEWGADGVIRSAVVTLGLLQNPDSLPAPPPIRRRVAAHEFGHVLGLPHSDRSDDLMFTSSPVSSPSRRDQATLQLLYVVNPGPIRTP